MHDSYSRLRFSQIFMYFIMQQHHNILWTVSMTVQSEDIPCGHTSYMGTSSKNIISQIQSSIETSFTNLNRLT